MDKIAVLIPCYNEEYTIARVLAGIQSFFAGMILEVLAAKDRRDFEYRLMKVNGEKRRGKAPCVQSPAGGTAADGGGRSQ